jgi:hypothetical protein
MRCSIVDRPRLTSVVALICACLLLSSCASTPADKVRISVKRIALSLAFKNEELAKPVAPEVIIRLIPAPPDVVASGDLTPYRTTPNAPPLPVLAPPPKLCPTAPQGATISQPVGVTIDQPPQAGWYRRFNKGSLGITAGPLVLKVPFPRVTLMEIKDVQVLQRPKVDSHAGDAAGQAPPLADAAGTVAGTRTVTRFTMVEYIGTVTITDVYEYDEAALRLVQRTTDTGGGTSTFTPSPQIVLVELGNYGNDWNEGGSDKDSSTAMVVRGATTAQEAVDVCGQLIDSLHYENDEQTVNLATQEVSGTSDTKNVYNIAPQKNGLLVREKKKFTQVVDVNGSKVVIDWDYTSTLGNLEPFPTRDAATVPGL